MTTNVVLEINEKMVNEMFDSTITINKQFRSLYKRGNKDAMFHSSPFSNYFAITSRDIKG